MLKLSQACLLKSFANIFFNPPAKARFYGDATQLFEIIILPQPFVVKKLSKKIVLTVYIYCYIIIYMKRSQSAEDYLECILLLSKENEFVHRVEVARRIGVSQPAVQKAVKILAEQGYIECDGMHLFLTGQGAEYAEKIYERHCIIRSFLTLHGVNAADADADACEMEHVISETTFGMMKNYVANYKG